MRRLTAHLIGLLMTPSWVGEALICMRVGRSYNGIWTGWITVLRPVLWDSVRPTARSCTSITTINAWLQTWITVAGMLHQQVLNTSQQIAKEACIRNSVAGRTRELSLCTQLWGHTLSTEFSFVPLTTRKISRPWNVSKREATKLMRSLEHKSYMGEQMRDLGYFSLEKRRLMGDLIALCNDLKGGFGGVGGQPLISSYSDTVRSVGLKLHQSRFRLRNRRFRACTSSGWWYQLPFLCPLMLSLYHKSPSDWAGMI